MTRRAVIYARLSVTTEVSVSIARQLAECRQYCARAGWEVVGEFVDDGVSASKTAPKDRPAWQALMSCPEPFETVVIWKLDRLARSTKHFLDVHEELEAAGKEVVATDGTIKMGKGMDKVGTVVMSAFAEMESQAISERVRAAYPAVLRQGRRAGGRPTFGWMNIDNPAGPGKVLAKDPERIEVVEEMARRALAGHSIYSITKWLNDAGIPTRPRRVNGAALEDEPVQAPWGDKSVEAILRSPLLAGMVPFRKDVLRGPDGLPIVDSETAVLTVAERRDLLSILAAAKRPGTRPRSHAKATLLWGLVTCTTCEGPMFRRTTGGRYENYVCSNKACRQKMSISLPSLDKYVEAQLLEHRAGSRPIVSVPVVPASPDVELLATIQAEIDQTLEAMREDDADDEALSERLRILKRGRAKARTAPAPTTTYRVSMTTVGWDWDHARTVEDRRKVVESQIEEVRISGVGRQGARMNPDRVDIVWRQVPDRDRTRWEGQLEVLERAGFRRGRSDEQ